MGTPNIPVQKGHRSFVECGPKRLEDMSQRFSSNYGSVAHSLSALFRQIERRKVRVRACDWNDPETFPRLAAIQQIESEAIDLDTVMDRVVKLARKELSADGIGVWLFTNNEIFFGAGAGNASNDERLRLSLLSTLLTSWRLSKGSLAPVGKPVLSEGEIKSWLLEPLYQGRDVAGVLAAFSSRLNSFSKLDSTKIHLLADVLANALTKASAGASAESTAMEPALLLRLIEQRIPGLQHIVDRDTPWADSIARVQKADLDYRAALKVSNAESAREVNDVDKTLCATSQVDTTWLETPEVSAVSADQQANAGTVRQMTSEDEVMGCSQIPSAAKNRGLAANVAKKHMMRALSGVSVAGSRLLNRSGPQSRRSLSTLFRTVTVTAVLVATVGVLVLRTTRYIGTEIPESSSVASELEKRDRVAGENPYREISEGGDVAPVTVEQLQVAEQGRTSASLQVSHMQVTDNNAKNALRALSQYEFLGLRRRALYGDDSAAFLMGMAYEIGHGVGQDCKAAALWVSHAAAEGNAVAQYNLGLRYRDGDGVPMNTEAAVKWLQKAAAHQIPGAQLALTALTARQGTR